MPKSFPRRGLVIAMDGPAGVGKSSVGNLVAKTLGYRFLNTGEMYRALTWKAIREKVDFEDAAAVVRLARKVRWDFVTADGSAALRTYLDGECVSKHIRDEEVSAKTSVVAAIPEVRRLLCRLQRNLGRSGSIVMEGRDITTHVLPHADLKIYLDASIEERAKRRIRQLRGAGADPDVDKVKRGIVSRDQKDLKRRINPLSLAPEATVIDSTHMSLRQVALKILGMIPPHHRAAGRRGGAMFRDARSAPETGRRKKRKP